MNAIPSAALRRRRCSRSELVQLEAILSQHAFREKNMMGVVCEDEDLGLP
jgi:hypothetical protein